MKLILFHDDKKWLQQLLSGLPDRVKDVLFFEYKVIFKNAANNEPVNFKKSNVARFAANSWIREEVRKLKHKEPEIVLKYRELIATPIPKCCHTCDNYADSGMCSEFNMQPPEEFAATIGECESWIIEVPF